MVWGYSMFKDFLGQIIRMKKIIGLRYFESVFMLNWGPNEQSETKKVWQNRETFVLVRVFNLVFQTSTVTICYCPPTPGWMEPGPVRPRTMQWTALKQVWKGCYVVAQELVRVSSKLSGSMKLPNITLAGVSWNPSSHNSDRTIKCASLLGPQGQLTPVCEVCLQDSFHSLWGSVTDEVAWNGHTLRDLSDKVRWLVIFNLLLLLLPIPWWPSGTWCPVTGDILGEPRSQQGQEEVTQHPSLSLPQYLVVSLPDTWCLPHMPGNRSYAKCNVRRLHYNLSPNPMLKEVVFWT